MSETVTALFLDVDGVLNTLEYLTYLRERGIRIDPVDPEAVVRLKHIIDNTHAEIILSSTWRIGKDSSWSPYQTLEKELAKQGLYITDCTPVLHGERGDEIKAYLQSRPEITNFVILDDDSDMGEYTDTPHFIKTRFHGPDAGLTQEIADKAIKILNSCT